MKERYLNLALILVAGILSYLCAPLAGFLSIDDAGMVSSLTSGQGYTVKSLFFSGASEYYRPLVVISYSLNATLFGLEPFSFHLINVAIHLANALLVYALALALFAGREDRERLSLTAALLFAVTPLNSEAVVWVSARPDLLCAFFFLLALLLLVKERERPSLRNLSLFSVAYLFSLCAKESSIALSAIAPLYLFLEARRGRLREAYLWSAAVLFTAGCYAWLRTGRNLQVDPGVQSVVKSVVTKVTGEESHYPPLLDALGAYGFYLKKLVLPYPLNFTILRYDRPWAFVSLALAVAAGCWLLRRYRLALLPLLIVFLGIVPALLAYLARIPWTPFGERYLYIPTIGFALLFALLVAGLKRVPRIVPVACLLLVSLATMARVSLWCDPVAFWNDSLSHAPRFAKSHSALGAATFEQGRLDEAERHFKEAISLGLDTPLAWQNLGRVYASQRELDKYEAAMLKAAYLSPRPAAIYQELIAFVMRSGGDHDLTTRYRRAIGYYLLAVEKEPSYVEAYYNVGKLYLATGDRPSARRYLRLYADCSKSGFFRPFALKLLQNMGENDNG